MPGAHTLDIVNHRLQAQQIAQPALCSPQAVVSWMGAMQAQEFAAAKWGIGLRAAGVTEADVDRAFDAGDILRTHVLRPTWHFVAPQDIRWMLALSRPRVHAANAQPYRRTGADPALFTRSRRALERALRGGQALTRTELAAVFDRAGAGARGQLLAYLMMHAELDGIICSGPRRGRQFTYMLLEERVPAARPLTREEALATLGRRFFASHGPATIQDFAWWSGLTVADAKVSLDLMKPVPTRVDDGSGHVCWLVESEMAALRHRPMVDLLPIYDEYLIAYRDRRAIVPSRADSEAPRHDERGHFLMIDGRLAGSWRLVEQRGVLQVRACPYQPLNRRTAAALRMRVEQLAHFAGRATTLSIV